MLFFNKKMLAITIVIGLSHTVANAYGQGRFVYKTLEAEQSPSIVFMKERMKEVRPGDNAWDIASEIFYDGYKWKDLVSQNPLLQEPGRVYHDGKQFYCMMKPGENLVTYQKFLPEIISEKVDTGGLIPTPDPKSGASIPLATSPDYDSIAFWIVGSLMGLVILSYLLSRFLRRRKEREADPVGSGQPQVEGGVSEENAAQRIMNIAEARGMTPLRVTNIQRGRLFGRGNVSYADVSSGLTKRFNGEVGYRGIILRTDGTQETIYFLQGCGNDAQERFFTNLRFVADEIQPELLAQHNLTNRIPISEQEGIQKASTDEVSEQPTTPFNAQQKVLEMTEKILTEKQEAFFEVTVGPMKIKLDTLNKVSGNNSRKNQPPKNEPSKKAS